MKALAFNIGAQNFLLDIELVLRITPSGKMLFPQNAPGFLLGIAKFRNKVVPVVAPKEAVRAKTDSTPKLTACFIILLGPLGPLGIHADATRGILDIDPENLPSKKSGGKKGSVSRNGTDYAWVEVNDLLKAEEWEELKRFLEDLNRPE